MRVDALVRRLTLFDSVMLVVSGTIGAAIFITPADVLHAVPDPRFALLLWVVAGAVTLLAGLACAELGGMFPEAGGQYVFIREAYGSFPAALNPRSRSFLIRRKAASALMIFPVFP